MEWLPPPPPPRQPATRAWEPEDAPVPLTALVEMAYIVVEELLEETVSLTVSQWPGVDERGRLVFAGRTDAVFVNRNAFQQMLRSQRQVGQQIEITSDRARAIRERPVEVGDVFAARLAPRRRGRRPADPAQLFDGSVIDISAQAREAAKTSFLAAVTPTLAPREARRMIDFDEKHRGDRG